MSGWVKIKKDLSGSPDFWRLARALEASKGDRYASARAMNAVIELWWYAAENATAEGVIECDDVEDLAYRAIN